MLIVECQVERFCELEVRVYFNLAVLSEDKRDCRQFAAFSLLINLFLLSFPLRQLAAANEFLMSVSDLLLKLR